jgi:lipopolysaccharide/colanic/teichoic acid biosynthesis glycosyltransferase
MYLKILKVFFDFITALLGLLVLFPVLLLVIIGLSFANNGKPFFFQTRPGKDGKLFRIIKFKTMNDKKDSEGNLLSDGERLTKIGKFVRKTSLDEMPQLANVILGDMSIVGPRPLLPEYLPLYSKTQSRRHELKPGITGWAQVNGRNAISWQQKFEFDVWYVDNISFLLDLKIIYRTIINIFHSKDINQKDKATVDYFVGN